METAPVLSTVWVTPLWSVWVSLCSAAYTKLLAGMDFSSTCRMVGGRKNRAQVGANQIWGHSGEPDDSHVCVAHGGIWPNCYVWDSTAFSSLLKGSGISPAEKYKGISSAIWWPQLTLWSQWVWSYSRGRADGVWPSKAGLFRGIEGYIEV